MRNPHPHVAWRNDRPRFSPGAGLRAEGFKGTDLRWPAEPSAGWKITDLKPGDQNAGRWFLKSEAIDWSLAFQKQHKPGRAYRADGDKFSAPMRRGFVYFLWVGDRIKIGFSTSPTLRIGTLMTGNGQAMKFFAAVAGTRSDERALHKVLASRRAQGEWFKPTLKVIRVMQRCVEKGMGPLAEHRK